MQLKKYLIIFIILIQSNLQAQNLIQNPSFEEFTLCPNDDSQIEYSEHWQCAVEWGCSSDYFNTCMFSDSFIVAPLIERIIRHKPRTESAFAGIYTFIHSNFNNSVREAITIKLKENLVINNCYEAHFYVKFYGFWNIDFYKHVNCAINSIGMYIGLDSVLYTSPQFPTNLFTYQPQINYNDSILKDSINWVKISGTFIANGGEQWITIANFLPDDSISIFLLNSLMPYLDTNDYRSYYLIDDVSVFPCDAPVYYADAGKDTCIMRGKNITLGLPNRDEYLYWWINGNTGDTISRQSQIVVSPQVTTTYILVQKDFKFDETRDTITINIDPNCSSISESEFVIYPNPNDGNFQVRFNRLVPEGAKLQLFDLLGRQVGEYLLTGNIAFLSVEMAKSLYYAKIVAPDFQTKSVKIVILK